MPKIEKARHWAFVAYPESVAEDWLEQLKLSGLKCAISPLHDKDEHSDPAVGDGKKPHWHVIVSWEGPITQSNAERLSVGKINGTIPVRLESVRGYYRYFTHADDPDKYQYEEKDIELIGGFSILDHTEMTRGERMRLMWEIQEFIDDNDIMEYGRLIRLLKQAGLREMWEVAFTNTIALNSYISSNRNEREQEAERQRAEAAALRILEGRPPQG